MNSTRMRYAPRPRWVLKEIQRRQCERRTDRAAGQHIARIVQPKYYARGGDQAGKWYEHPAELGKVRHRLPGESHGVQGVAGGEAVAIQRRHHLRDARLADERPLTHQGVL